MKSSSNKTRINFYIDLILLLLLAFLIGVGILIKFVLIPGQESWLLYGTNMQLTFLGMDRHEWGTVHLITGILFFLFFVLHIIFHWKMIGCMFRKCVTGHASRFIFAFLAIGLFVFLIVFPFFITPQKTPVNRGFGELPLEEMGVDLNDSLRIELKKPKLQGNESGVEIQIKRKNRQHDLNIHGNMTLSEVAEKYMIDESYLKEELNLPANVSVNQNIGQLKKQYGFTMAELKDIVRQELLERKRSIE
jgi:hypothetical protein